MELADEIVRLPFDDGAYRMAMGLVAARADTLFEVDARYAAEIAARRDLFERERDEVFAALPGTETARAETLALVADVLPRAFPTLFQVEDGVLRNALTGERWALRDPPLDPLEVAGRLVQEDLCLIDPTGPDGPVLAAGVLCFPSHWRLRDKLGLPLAAVHGPVPLYADRLAAPVDRFMRHLRPGRVAERLNWSVTDREALRLVAGHGRREANAAITAENAGDKLFLRVERQTLSLLPESGFVLFTIRVHRTRLAACIDRAAAARLAGAVRALPPEMSVYKSILPFKDAVLAWLDRTAGRL